MCRNLRRPSSAFTLLEVLVVLGILSFLAAILFPVFGTVRGRARQTACLSNLHQIGQGVTQYIQDYDGFYPRAVDASDKLYPGNWGELSDFTSEVPKLPYLQNVLAPYAPSRELFHCPSDIGFGVSDFTEQTMDAFPTSFAKFGSSYYYRTEMAALRYHESQVGGAAKINLIFDGAGAWHGSRFPQRKRYNVLFGDFHTKNVSNEEMEAAWRENVVTP